MQMDGADIIIVDDIIDSADTVCTISSRVKALGARNIYICASHGLFTGESLDKINHSDISKVIVTDSLPMPTENNQKIVQLSVSPLLAKIIFAEHFRRVLVSENTIIPESAVIA